MAYSQHQIIDRALRIATMTGGDPNLSSVIDNTVVLEDHFYTALRNAIIAGANVPTEVNGLKRDHTISVSNGVGTLPDSVIEECLDTSSIYADDTNVQQFSSYQPRYSDYLRSGHSQMGYYSTQGANFLYRGPNEEAGVFDGDIHLVAVSTPSIPSTITDPITISTEVAERTIQILASILRGNG